MNKEFIPYELAVKLKELKFNEPCLGFYDCERDFKIISNKTKFLDCEVAIPLYQQAFRWFREKYQASPTIHCMSEQGNSWKYHIPNEGGERDFNTYEEAELACLVKLIEITKNK